MDNGLSKYRGVWPAFYACYDEAGEISRERTAVLARQMMAEGVQGLYVNGSSGECVYLSVAERQAVLEAVVAAVGGQLPIIAHVAANSTRDSQALARHAQSLGVDAIAAIPPIYFKLSERAIAQYWNDISAAAPETDFIIYNIPQLAGVALTAGLFGEMLRNPNLIGVKNSSMPAHDIRLFKALGGDRVVVFNGPDEQYVAGRLMGAAGGIGSTYGLMPKLFLAAEAALEAGDVARAQAVQFGICEVIDRLFACQGHLLAIIKELLRRLRDLDLGSVRAPLPPVATADLPTIEQAGDLLLRAEAALG